MKDNTKKSSISKVHKTAVWVYKQHSSGDFWFVDVEGVEKWYFVHFNNRSTAIDGDSVKIQIKDFRGKEEGIIIEIVERSENTFSGVFFAGKTQNKKWHGFWFVRLNSSNITKDIFIPGKASKNANDKDAVIVKILRWEQKNPEGKIVDIVWPSDKKWIMLESLIAETWFKQEFPEKIEADLEKLKANIDPEERSKRKDLTDLMTFTIDGEDAKDLDDAISLEIDENGKGEYHKLYVHIADITHYVKEWSELDTLALKKWTSVYLADRVIPMLPRKLSNGLCSLNNDTEKLALTCEMHIAKNGEVFFINVYESIIKSNYRFTYKEIDELQAGKLDETSDLFGGWKLTAEIIKIITNAENLKKILTQSKLGKWMLEFDFPETKVLVEDYEVQKIYEYPKYESNDMIEQFMILANESVALHFKKYPFLYRVHEIPKDESIWKLVKALEAFGIDYSFYKISPLEFQELLTLVAKHPKRKAIEKLVLRTLQKAEYKDKNLKHFWLASSHYSHFTSPIRRYPDLQIHRIIKQKLARKLTPEKIAHYKEILPQVAQKSSGQEQKAEKLEYRVRDYYITQFYSNKIGEEFEATVSWLIKPWVFVELPDSAEWFVEMNTTIFEFDQEQAMFHNKQSGKHVQLWDELKVRLKEADMKLLRLNFEII